MFLFIESTYSIPGEIGAIPVGVPVAEQEAAPKPPGWYSLREELGTQLGPATQTRPLRLNLSPRMLLWGQAPGPSRKLPARDRAESPGHFPVTGCSGWLR